jgi:hypothetical protein
MRINQLAYSFLVVLATGTLSAAHAQQPGWSDVAVSLSHVDYDLSGTGSALGLAVRTTHPLSDRVRVEVRALFSKPDQQFGPSTLFLPETQLQFGWRVGRASPYVGGGIGAAMVKSSYHTDWDPTLSLAAGTGVRLSDRLGLTGEFRLRGHEWEFTGTTAELSAGLAWSLPFF